MSVVPFEPLTIQKMREVFDGHTCCRCGRPAQRFKSIDRDTDHDHLMFFCGDCFSEASVNGLRNWQNEDRYRTFRYRKIRGKRKLAD